MTAQATQVPSARARQAAEAPVGTAVVTGSGPGAISVSITYVLSRAHVEAILFACPQTTPRELAEDGESAEPRERAARRLVQCLIAPDGVLAEMGLRYEDEGSQNPEWTSQVRSTARTLFAGGEEVSGLIDAQGDVYAMAAPPRTAGVPRRNSRGPAVLLP